MSPMDKFKIWFDQPLRDPALRKDGHGAFIGFGAALALYERFIKARLKRKGERGSPANFQAEAATDLGVDPDDFKLWWEIFRDGINHQASPKKVRSNGVDYGWLFSDAYEAIPVKDGSVFKVDPWKFVDLVLDKYSVEHDALTTSDTYSLGDIGFEIVVEV